MNANREQAADVLRSQLMPARQDQGARGDILASLNHIFARGGGAQDFDFAFADGLRVFQHDDGIGARWQHAAGMDEQGIAGVDVVPRRFTHLQLATKP